MSAPASTCTGSPKEKEDDDDDKFPKPCRNMRIRVSAHASSLRRSSSAVMALADLTNSRKHKKKSGSGSPCRTKNARLLMNGFVRRFAPRQCLNGMKPRTPPSTYPTSPNYAIMHDLRSSDLLFETWQIPPKMQDCDSLPLGFPNSELPNPEPVSVKVRLTSARRTDLLYSHTTDRRTFTRAFTSRLRTSLDTPSSQSSSTKDHRAAGIQPEQQGFESIDFHLIVCLRFETRRS
jgi:hypothetical protein